MVSHGARHGCRDPGNDGTRRRDGRRAGAKRSPDLVGVEAEEAGAGRSRRRCAVPAGDHGRETLARVIESVMCILQRK
jgi:hypothetical protein